MSKKKKQQAQINSMTGFGRGSAEFDGVNLSVELKALNSRFLDLTFRIPREYNPFEALIRTWLQESFSRGRVEVFIRRDCLKRESAAVSFNQTLFDECAEIYKRSASAHGDKGAGWVQSLFQRREILDLVETAEDVEGEVEELRAALDIAVKELSSMRAEEGERLKAELFVQLEKIEECRARIAQIAPELPGLLKQRLEERINDLDDSIALDSEKLAAEVALLADKVDIREELVRISSHIEQIDSSVNSGGVIGRKLEFLLQELNREFNTIGSKTSESEVQHLVVSAKTILEKLREQAANIE